MAYRQITSQQAKELIENINEAVLVDIRDSDSYNDGHVTNAQHLTQESLPAFLSQTNRDLPILVMCYHGNSSQMVAQFLSEQGFAEVYSIEGGYEEWF